MRHRPLVVTIVAWVYIAAGAAGVIHHAGDFRSGSHAEALFTLAVRLLAIVAGVLMLRGNRSARWLALLWIGFHVIVSVFHSAAGFAMHALLFAVIAWVLFRREANEYFRGR